MFTQSEIIAARSQMLDQMRARLVEMEAAFESAKNALTTNGWVVTNTGVYMVYEFEGMNVKNCQARGILSATKLSKQNAVHLASQTFNGANKVAEAKPYILALSQEIDSMKNLIETLEGQQ